MLQSKAKRMNPIDYPHTMWHPLVIFFSKLIKAIAFKISKFKRHLKNSLNSLLYYANLFFISLNLSKALGTIPKQSQTRTIQSITIQSNSEFLHLTQQDLLIRGNKLLRVILYYFFLNEVFYLVTQETQNRVANN